MADHEKDRQMDEMLDSLLANYSSVEPRPGMETRILTNLRDAEMQQPARRSWNFGWAWAVAGVAVAIIVIAAVLFSGRPSVKAPVVVKNPSAPVQPKAPQGMPETATIRPEHHRPKAAVLPFAHNAGLALRQRPAIFPTPTPLSEQERFMLAYLANTPHEEIIAQTQRDEKEADAFWGDRDTSPEIPAPVNPTRR